MTNYMMCCWYAIDSLCVFIYLHLGMMRNDRDLSQSLPSAVRWRLCRCRRLCDGGFRWGEIICGSEIAAVGCVVADLLWSDFYLGFMLPFTAVMCYPFTIVAVGCAVAFSAVAAGRVTMVPGVVNRLWVGIVVHVAAVGCGSVMIWFFLGFMLPFYHRCRRLWDGVSAVAVGCGMAFPPLPPAICNDLLFDLGFLLVVRDVADYHSGDAAVGLDCCAKLSLLVVL
ncbi:hypothetical protein QVD17_35780 [Tagetes erecta]|uniref:Uncharacterized protein n=1 Tax=Tagetes erecta TaxID=13708 RepID=A0AAD8JR63_TARER|nr:hypothetical protein QVD17_35780 [Tagetes erecta]